MQARYANAWQVKRSRLHLGRPILTILGRSFFLIEPSRGLRPGSFLSVVWRLQG